LLPPYSHFYQDLGKREAGEKVKHAIYINSLHKTSSLLCPISNLRYFRASFRYAFLSSASVAPLATPKTCVDIKHKGKLLSATARSSLNPASTSITCLVEVLASHAFTLALNVDDV
jgi:hypothetical protein